MCRFDSFILGIFCALVYLTSSVCYFSLHFTLIVCYASPHHALGYATQSHYLGCSWDWIVSYRSNHVTFIVEDGHGIATWSFLIMWSPFLHMIRTFIRPLTLWPIPTPLFPLSISGEKGLQAFQSICVATLPCFLRANCWNFHDNIFVTSFLIPDWYAIETLSLGFEYIYFSLLQVKIPFKCGRGPVELPWIHYCPPLMSKASSHGTPRHWLVKCLRWFKSPFLPHHPKSQERFCWDLITSRTLWRTKLGRHIGSHENLKPWIQQTLSSGFQVMKSLQVYRILKGKEGSKVS